VPDLIFPPGSIRAEENGCTCPVMDNAHGDGRIIDGKRVWVFDAECPYHNPPKEARS